MICQRSLDYKHPTIEISKNLLFCDNVNDALIYFVFLVLNLVNILFYTSFYWKWCSSCHVFVKWPVG